MAKKKELRVLVKEPGKEPVEASIFDDGGDGILRGLQTRCGGWVALVQAPNKVDLWCDEEGLLKGLKLNLITPGSGPIVGTVVFAARTRGGRTIGLTDPQLDYARQLCEEMGVVAA